MYNTLVMSNNYVTKRQSLKLLGEILLDRANYSIMTRYIASEANLKLMMNFLRDRSRNIQFEAFHVFKVGPARGGELTARYLWPTRTSHQRLLEFSSGTGIGCWYSSRTFTTTRTVSVGVDVGLWVLVWDWVRQVLLVVRVPCTAPPSWWKSTLDAVGDHIFGQCRLQPRCGSAACIRPAVGTGDQFPAHVGAAASLLSP